jgi:hypothetical protein
VGSIEAAELEPASVARLGVSLGKVLDVSLGASLGALLGGMLTELAVTFGGIDALY